MSRKKVYPEKKYTDPNMLSLTEMICSRFGISAKAKEALVALPVNSDFQS